MSIQGLQSSVDTEERKPQSMPDLRKELERLQGDEYKYVLEGMNSLDRSLLGLRIGWQLNIRYDGYMPLYKKHGAYLQFTLMDTHDTFCARTKYEAVQKVKRYRYNREL